MTGCPGLDGYLFLLEAHFLEGRIQMTLVQLEYFETVAKCGSMSKAAEKLFVTQPAISKQIMLLERELGIMLLHRSYNSISPTPAGKIILDHIDIEKKTFAAVLEKARLVDGIKYATMFSVGIMESADIENFTLGINQFAHDNPNVFIKLEELNLASLVSGLILKKFDLIITLDYSIRSTKDIQVSALTKAQHQGYISLEHRFASKPNLSLSDLSPECFYVPSVDNDPLNSDFLKHICAAYGFAPSEIIALPNIDSVLLAVQMGFGAAVLDDHIALKSNIKLVRIPTKVYSAVVFAWRKNDSNPNIPVFINTVKNMVLNSETDNREN